MYRTIRKISVKFLFLSHQEYDFYLFRRWWKKAQNPEYKTQSKVLKRLKNLQLFEGKSLI